MLLEAPNACSAAGIFPFRYKVARFVLISKRKSDPETLRVYCLLSTTDWHNTAAGLSPKQYSLRAGRSTFDGIQEVVQGVRLAAFCGCLHIEGGWGIYPWFWPLESLIIRLSARTRDSCRIASGRKYRWCCGTGCERSNKLSAHWEKPRKWYEDLVGTDSVSLRTGGWQHWSKRTGNNGFRKAMFEMGQRATKKKLTFKSCCLTSIRFVAFSVFFRWDECCNTKWIRVVTLFRGTIFP